MIYKPKTPLSQDSGVFCLTRLLRVLLHIIAYFRIFWLSLVAEVAVGSSIFKSKPGLNMVKNPRKAQEPQTFLNFLRPLFFTRISYNKDKKYINSGGLYAQRKAME